MAFSLPFHLALPGAGKAAIPKSQAEKMWLVGGGLVGLVFVLIGYFFFIGPQRADTSEVQSQVDNAQLQNTTLQARITSLRLESKNLPKYTAELAAARLALPSTDGGATFLRSMQQLGTITSTKVSSLTLGPPTAIVAAPAAAAAASPSPAAAPAATAAAAPSMYSMAISASVTGSPANLNRFLQQLQAVQPRAVLVTSLTESSAADSAASRGDTTLALTMQAFVAPTNLAPAVAATPSATATP